MFILARALVYATLFVGFGLVFLPSRVLRWSGIASPNRTGMSQVLAVSLVAAGALLVFSCILTFVFVGKGTTAPFDPPRRLVVSGPYHYVRNPIYMGADCALFGAALYYHSLGLLVYGMLFFAFMHIWVRTYEEPALRRTFGHEYEAYCAQVHRWWPRRPARTVPPN